MPIIIFKDSQTNRTLTLVSKTIQSLGNLVCSRSNFKEEYMSSMYQSVYTEQHVTAVRQVKLFTINNIL